MINLFFTKHLGYKLLNNEVLYKKNDDVYSLAYVEWTKKYPIEKINSKHTLEQGLKELFAIPADSMGDDVIGEISTWMQKIAEKSQEYKNLIIEKLLKKKSIVHTKWFDATLCICSKGP